MVIHRNRVGQGDNFSVSQIVERGVGCRECHRYAACGGARCLGDRADADQRLELVSSQHEPGFHAVGRYSRDRSRVPHIGQVHVAKTGRNTLGQRAGRCLFDQVRLGNRSDDGCIVGAVDGHRQRTGRCTAIGVVDGVGKDIVQVFTNRQCLHCGIAIGHRIGVTAVSTDGQSAVITGSAGCFNSHRKRRYV